MKENKRTRLSAKFYVSLDMLIPVIFSGISVLAILGAHLITAGYPGATLPKPLWLWSSVIAAITFACGLLITWLVLKPVRRFVEETQKFASLRKLAPVKTPADEEKDEITLYTEVFDRVTEFIGKIEAKELFPDMVGESKALRALMGQILKVAPTDSTVLITGESGTGKELAANSIYEHSLRKGKPFIKINCIAIPEGLIESELFGHERGAFTGAVAQKAGKFELADGGTILLDEIGDMPAHTQAKLLRVLQEREFQRVGGTKTIRTDVRIIASSNKDLLSMVKDGLFREDLYYRLNVFTLHLPPLRERMEDIPVLAAHFLSMSQAPVRISPAALDLMLEYTWSGNIRELRNVIERAAVLAEDTIEPHHLSPLGAYRQPQVSLDAPIDERLREIENALIVKALRRAGGVQARAAEILGINQRSLWHRVRKHGIDPSSFKPLAIHIKREVNSFPANGKARKGGGIGKPVQ